MPNTIRGSSALAVNGIIMIGRSIIVTSIKDKKRDSDSKHAVGERLDARGFGLSGA